MRHPLPCSVAPVPQTHDARRISTLPFLSLLVCLCLSGCGAGVFGTPAALQISGSVLGGHKAIPGAAIQLYAAGVTGAAAAATPLLPQPVRTDNAGHFALEGNYICPNPAANVYLVAQGGDPAVGQGARNNAIGLMAALGACGSLKAGTVVQVNEVTTVGAVWPLAQYIRSPGNIGFPDASTAQRVQTKISMLVNPGSGTSPGAGLPQNETDLSLKVNTLANALAGCVDGYQDGENSAACQDLFAQSSFTAQTGPRDTLAAAIALAQHAQSSMPGLLALSNRYAPFEPSLSAAPVDWTLDPGAPGQPVVTPDSGTYTRGQTVTIHEATPDAQVRYTTDGSTPTASSAIYRVPFALAQSTVVKAAAFLGPLQSTVAASTYTVPQVRVTLTPNATRVLAGGNIQFVANVSGTPNKAVAWKLSSSLGNLSSDGLYRAPAVAGAPATLQVIATSLADPSQSASATVELAPAPAITIDSPVSVEAGATVQINLTLSSPLPVPVSITPVLGDTSVAAIAPGGTTIPPGHTSATITLTGLSAGTTSLSVSGAGVVSAASSLTVIPPAIPSTFMGMTVKDFQHALPQFSFGTTRSWDGVGLSWSEMNPAPGAYDFHALDAFIQLNQSRHAEMIYTFGRTPQWASSRPQQAGPYGPGQCAPPASLATWDSFVTAIATHAAGRIRYWELWNEPNSQDFFCGDIPTLVTMAQHASAIIKAIDPSAQILSPAMTSAAGPSWLGYFLYLGGTKYVDIISFHGYSSTTAADILPLIAQYRISMLANGAATLPLWDTEASWAGNGDQVTPAVADQVSFIAKYYLLQRSAGVDRLVWYAFDGGNTWGGLWNSATGATAAAAAFQETSRWLVGASLTAPCSRSPTGVWRCSLARSGGYHAQVLWSDSGNQQVPVPPTFVESRSLSDQVTPLTAQTVQLGSQPVLLESGPITP